MISSLKLSRLRVTKTRETFSWYQVLVPRVQETLTRAKLREDANANAKPRLVRRHQVLAPRVNETPTTEVRANARRRGREREPKVTRARKERVKSKKKKKGKGWMKGQAGDGQKKHMPNWSSEEMFLLADAKKKLGLFSKCW